MSDARDDGGGWTFLRVIGLIVGIVAMAGFGFCSLFGLVLGGGSEIELLLMFIVPGIVLALLGFLLARRMLRLARGRDEGRGQQWHR